ncbi:thiamine phosphate synthase [Providencia stuartii]|uniref:Thiamine-phosphate synthase n=2 Tax=Providencia TaxID=586 RepID=A0A1S1HN86_PROST|nr:MULTISPECIES: thiamine phosphate synthase [Providencia]MDV5228216.1 thiamine phosphate synthase [Providencia rettgeri]ELR5040552.1 thiamine phosphate synthase [Providencia stuartii]ELR5084271.1 thiamine phosphate synthase [Providencia stuartii]ELR5115090.1 thiamine phosphate synthase [Providencia stuartii]ELR5302274.1 thiamine phosphate synthase [Providencia stuartii]
MKKLPNTPFPPTERYLGLYPVVDSVEWIERLLNAGVTTIQLRIKDKQNDEVRDAIQQAIALGKQHNARLFINDYWQLAVELGAYGVHLGQEDLETTDLVAIHQAGLRLGVSTHDEHELAIAKSVRPSYIAMGHIFPTETKVMPSSPQGLETLKSMVEATPDYPTVAIGGISIDKVPAVLATGVGSVALVSAITKADDWLAATKSLLQLVENH